MGTKEKPCMDCKYSVYAEWKAADAAGKDTCYVCHLASEWVANPERKGNK